MSLIKDILIYVDDSCINDFNAAIQFENLDITKVQRFSVGGPEKFAILAENITPYLKPVINVIKQLARVHRKKVFFELERKDGSVFRSSIDGYSKDEAIEIINEAVRLSMQVSSDDHS
ncbi:hypothetical protein MBP03_09250 [Klebsiella pneumoniae]|nr:hypothetical protein MBP03_09250 [Klebsiella pneumoniae]HEO1744546.1 hypothetical protein [Klebsiella pneumoniae]